MTEKPDFKKKDWQYGFEGGGNKVPSDPLPGTSRPATPSNNPTPKDPPKGSALGRLLKLGVFMVVLAGGYLVYAHGVKVGTQRAKADPAKAGFVAPWEWTPEERSGFMGTAKEAGEQVKEASKLAQEAWSKKADDLKKRIEERKKQREAATPVGTEPTKAVPPTPVGTEPTKAVEPTGTPTEPAKVPSAATLPPGYEKIHAIVQEAENNFLKDGNKVCKAKCEEAIALLKPLSEKPPVHPRVTEDLKLVTDLLDACNSQ